ncbi:MAG: 2-hydroxyacyl-CoA dehydratase family protein [Chloroflexota bacterium]|nr:2-hydroxyacyl-CoA dehydratase family protein [Chloroflexota bacterium]
MSTEAVSGGLASVERLYRNRAEGSLELKSQGKKIMGYFYCLTPIEMLTAFGLVPHRVTGSTMEPAVESDAYLETNACSFVHSCLDLVIRRQYDFLDGFIVPHSCDHFTKAYPVFKYHFNLPYSLFLNVPHLSDESSINFFKMELEGFKRSLEKFTQNEYSAEKLKDAIRLHNRNRALVRDLYELRKYDPPRISGSEIVKVLTAAMRLPVEESNDLIKSVINEVEGRDTAQPTENIRLLIYSPVIDESPLMELIEECKSDVVMDVLCSGSMNYFSDIEITEDPLDGIAQYYLEILSPRTYNKPRIGSHQEDVENRFAYIYDYTKEFNAHAVILYALRHCEVFGFDLPDVRDYLQSKGLLVLVIEDEYSMTSTARLRTRIEAFIESVHQSKGR